MMECRCTRGQYSSFLGPHDSRPCVRYVTLGCQDCRIGTANLEQKRRYEVCDFVTYLKKPVLRSLRTPKRTDIGRKYFVSIKNASFEITYVTKNTKIMFWLRMIKH
jgi:hypothetical protein